MADETQYVDRYWTSRDGVRLHCRDYPGPKARPPIICIPGLTRNARDFHHVAERLAGQWRVICVDLRGRGDSAPAKDASSYAPEIYVDDLEIIFKELKIKKFICFGTSLGGILTFLLSAAKPGRIVGALINDIGPELEERGLDRIRGHVGKSQTWPTWVHAARWMSEVQGHAFPQYELAQWIAFAKRVCRLTAQGRIVLDYDMAIAEPIRAGQGSADLWPYYGALGDVPVTILRGELSELLSEATVRKMAKRLPNTRQVTVKGVGHAPMLDEPEAVRAIDALLKVVAS